jgi:hypothetical protein
VLRLCVGAAAAVLPFLLQLLDCDGHVFCFGRGEEVAAAVETANNSIERGVTVPHSSLAPSCKAATTNGPETGGVHRLRIPESVR